MRDRRHSYASGDLCKRTRHFTGAMFVTRVNRAHAMSLGQRNAPVHVAVAEQREMRVDALCGKGVSEHVIKAVIRHCAAFRPDQTD